ncbi:MAG: metallophosphoesterase [Bacteroidales bacterium]|nr:metallophosphoesterase [Bacteroidales bacterium]
MKRYLLTVLLMLGLMPFGATAQRLVIVHTNDIHSQIEPFRIGRDAGRGGVERIKVCIDSIRSVYGKNNVLVLDAGDYNQGTPYFTVSRGDLEVEVMNTIGYDLAALGNHEFDNGQQELVRRLKAANFETLCCTYDLSATPLQGIVKPCAIVKRGGLKIGVIGATTDLSYVAAAGNIEGMRLLDIISEINRWADWLHYDKGCDLVILLSHLGYEVGSARNPSDEMVAAESTNIDLIIGGHSHTFMKKPAEVANKNGRIVPIVQTGAKGVNVGEFKIF